MTGTLHILATQIVRELDVPLVFGAFVVTTRSYCRVDVRTESGRLGSATTLDRGLPVHDVVNQLVAPAYGRVDPDDALGAWERVLRSNVPALSSGGGLRALSLVDLALRDAQGKVPEYSGHPDVWAVVGYPPTAAPGEVVRQVAEALSAGAAGVKMPFAGGPELSRARLEAAVELAGPGRVAFDLAWSGASAEEVAGLVGDLPLAWVEDPFPPGQVPELKALRRLIEIPVASGDEEGHLYHPEQLLNEDAVDVVRMDVTCQGGLSRIELLRDSGGSAQMPVSWHMNPRWNLAAAAILGAEPWSVEVSAPGSGVDPLAEIRPLAESIADPSDAVGRGITQSTAKGPSAH